MSLVMSYLMKMCFPLLSFILMPVDDSAMKFFFCLHIHLLVLVGMYNLMILCLCLLCQLLLTILRMLSNLLMRMSQKIQISVKTVKKMSQTVKKQILYKTTRR